MKFPVLALMGVVLGGGAVYLMATHAFADAGGAGGGDAESAQSLAEALAADLTARQYDYDRALCKRFQLAAGIAADGIYGPGTRAALGRYVANPPAALFKGAKAAA